MMPKNREQREVVDRAATYVVNRRGQSSTIPKFPMRGYKDRGYRQQFRDVVFVTRVR
jgi:hypothetical protein